MPILKRPLLLLAAAALLAAGARDAAAQFLRVPPVAPGSEFPALKVSVLDRDDPSKSVVRNLRSLTDGATSVLYFWIPDNRRSEAVLADLQLLANDAEGKMRVFPVTAISPGVTRELTAARARALGLTAPLLLDDGYQIAQALQVMTVPHIAVLDKKGVLRLRDGASLLQPVDGRTTLADYLRAGAAGERLATVEKLDFYHPAVENVGQRFFEFKLTSFPDGREAAISDYVEPGKITALFFWSPKCPHCKEALPSVNRARAKYKDKVNFISVTQLPTAEAREACSEVMRLFRIDFPVLVDETGEASGAYKVVSTPTTVVIQPSGTVSACYFSGEADYERLFEAEIGKIAKTARP